MWLLNLSDAVDLSHSLAPNSKVAFDEVGIVVNET